MQQDKYFNNLSKKLLIIITLVLKRLMLFLCKVLDHKSYWNGNQVFLVLARSESFAQSLIRKSSTVGTDHLPLCRPRYMGYKSSSIQGCEWSVCCTWDRVLTFPETLTCLRSCVLMHHIFELLCLYQEQVFPRIKIMVGLCIFFPF